MLGMRQVILSFQRDLGFCREGVETSVSLGAKVIFYWLGLLAPA